MPAAQRIAGVNPDTLRGFWCKRAARRFGRHHDEERYAGLKDLELRELKRSNEIRRARRCRETDRPGKNL
jgi:hypothetical protein